MNAPNPTDTRQQVDYELDRWSRTYHGDEYYYGSEPGPVARRAVRYHRPALPTGGTALDAGCGEGQDLVFLAERGYAVTGVEFTPEGAEKARRLLAEQSIPGEVIQQDLRDFTEACIRDGRTFDLVLAVNAVQFLGSDASAVLDRLAEMVAPGGVLAISLFGREAREPTLRGTIWFTTLEETLSRFAGWKPLEAADVYQWGYGGSRPQPFVTLIARKV
jgi:SAM-dependent methyltransferase